VIACADGVERLGTTATVLGAFREWDCEERSVQLAPRDTLVAFSDGVTEAGIDTDEEFGEGRLLDLLNSHRQGPLDALIAGLIEAAQACDPVQADDITVVALRAG